MKKGRKNFFSLKKTPGKAFVFLLGAGLLALVMLLGGLALIYKNKIYPGVTALGLNLGGLTREEAVAQISEQADQIEQSRLVLKKANRNVEADLGELGIELDRERMAEEAFKAGRQENFGGNGLAVLENVIWGFRVPNFFYVIEDRLNVFVAKELEELSRLPQSAKVVFENGSFIITPAKSGYGVDSLMLAAQIIDYVESADSAQEEVFEIEVGEDVAKKPEVEAYQALEARDKANRILALDPQLRAGDKKWQVERETLASFFVFKKTPDFAFRKTRLDLRQDDLFTATYYALSGISPQKNSGGYRLKLAFDEDKIRNYLGTVAPGIEQPAVNATLSFNEEESKIVIETASQDQVSLNTESSIEKLIEGLSGEETEIELATTREKAPIAEETIDELGIKTLVAIGTSNFAGSPKNRRHNIAIGASKFNGVVIKPGERFSFLDNLGPVDASTGYLPELVIKNDKTIPEYGGGMCQVSTTAFRGAVNAGFEIYERKNHAYPVQYYAPQGTDATVYIPSPDLKFINNTGAHVLIQTKIEGNILTFEYYGTDDGRRVETEGPVAYDRKPDGAMKAKWTQRVYRADGSLMLEKVFLSKYDSPAKYPHPGEEEPDKDKKDKKKKKKKN